MAAVLLGVLAVTVAVITVVVVGASRPDDPVPSASASVASAGSSGSAGPPVTTGTKSIRPYPNLPDGTGGSVTTSPPPPIDAGGLTQARRRVADFVDALNRDDTDLANTFLCARMAGGFGEHMLDGIVPGSLGVGGVSVQGSTGTAFVTYQPTDDDEQTRVTFGLVVEHDLWMICTPPR